MIHPTLASAAAIALAVLASAGPALADVEFLSFGRTFAEPVADPRWPRFAASWQEYGGDPFLDSAGAVAFGGTFAFLHDRPPPGEPSSRPTWEVGLQAGVFGTFEPLEVSQGLFNSDWIVGAYAAGRRGDFSGILRLWHQSSHLGDEFILSHPEVQRIDFRFESFSGLVAWDVTPWARVYGGGGVLFSANPADYSDLFIQYGLELRSPRRIFGDYAQPFVAIDVQHLEPTGWQGDVSLLAGLEIHRSRPDAPTLRVALEFYSGRNQNGQFYEENVHYAGIGVQLGL